MLPDDLYEAGLGESDPIYQRVARANLQRQYQFLESIIQASLDKGISLFSHSLIKALNVHAIAGLHSSAGEYRSTEVVVGNFNPVDAALVPSEMDDLVLAIQRNWLAADTVNLGAFTLWVINHIHPFVNGNGRTARALCYYVICVKADRLLPGHPMLPELLSEPDVHPHYTEALKQADQRNFVPLHDLIQRLLVRQLSPN